MKRQTTAQRLRAVGKRAANQLGHAPFNFPDKPKPWAGRKVLDWIDEDGDKWSVTQRPKDAAEWRRWLRLP